MGPSAVKAGVKVTLSQRVVVADGVVFDAERDIELPVPPTAGMHLYGTHWVPPGCDESDEPIEEVGFDLKTNRLICYMPVDDFRLESSGFDDWTEEEIRKRYQDWTIEPDRQL